MVSNVQEEYWFFVSPQEELPLAGSVEVDMDLPRIMHFFAEMGALDASALRRGLADYLLKAPSMFHDIRQFLGLSDKRAYLDLSYIASRTPHPTSNTSLCGCQPWTLARHPLEFFVSLLHPAKPMEVRRSAALMLSDYLMKHGLETAAPSFADMSEDTLRLLYLRLISPKEYQQRAAKRRGHGCEAALAKILVEIGLPTIPEDKASNPMGARDPNVDLNSMTITARTAGTTYSFDTVIADGGLPRILVQSLIHTSDPGQYGVNKSDETVAVAREVAAWTKNNPERPVELWGLLDGVGFSENKPQTLNKLLSNVGHFVQLRTLFKAGLRAHELGLTVVDGIVFEDGLGADAIDFMAHSYVPKGVPVLSKSRIDSLQRKTKIIKAGAASLVIAI
ncbi:hypothetical protein ELG79_22085 [Rhizobium leguminosarum]|uniref:hypothetical protein n=1 Tax=Rhizobium leguminosarum TaxID=384 RepID=UPI0010310196|nr:hypothetical protein [Rhizobium leguminosarum]TBG27779.1 hypothetical protein ELG79_22085 [Rhizobium leguminosarum]